MWVNPSRSQERFEVLEGKADLDSIAGCTALNRRTVQRALVWLADSEWIDTARQSMPGGRETNRYIRIKLDADGHELRRTMRTNEGVTESPPGVSQSHPRRVSQSHP
jgi:hypothetical protein